MTKPGFEEKRMAQWRAVMEKEFNNSVGDEGLFPNHSDKDIWMAGFEAGYQYNDRTTNTEYSVHPKVKRATVSANDISFHGVTLQSTVEELIAVLGEPDFSGNTGEDKVNYEWILETSNGQIFTIYDWKHYRPIDRNELIEWHIGAYSIRVCNAAKNELIEDINNTNDKSKHT